MGTALGFALLKILRGERSGGQSPRLRRWLYRVPVGRYLGRSIYGG